MPVLWDDEREQLTPDERVEHVETLLCLYGADATVGLDAGTLLDRDDWHIARTAMEVDQKGWEDISEVFAESMNRIAMIKSEPESRAKKRDDLSMRILAYQSLCELPPRM